MAVDLSFLGSTANSAARPLTVNDQPQLVSASITQVAHLQAALQLQQPQSLAASLQTLLHLLPAAWQSIASSPPAVPHWVQCQSAAGSMFILRPHSSSLHSVSPSSELLQTVAQPVQPLHPVQVVLWDPSRPWRGPAAQQQQAVPAQYSQGKLWGAQHLSLRVWGFGGQPAHQLVVKQASQRLRLIQAFARGPSAATAGLTCKPRFMPVPGSDQTPSQLLESTEARWAAAVHSSAAGTTRLRSDTPDSLPSWMLPPQPGRLHWSQRQQQRQEQQQQPQSEPQQQVLPAQQASADDTVDVLEACGSHSQQSAWRHIWELASASYIDRQHRILWWRTLHGCLMCGAYKAYITGPAHSRLIALSHAASPQRSYKRSVTCSSHAQQQQRWSPGCASSGKPSLGICLRPQFQPCCWVTHPHGSYLHRPCCRLGTGSGWQSCTVSGQQLTWPSHRQSRLQPHSCHHSCHQHQHQRQHRHQRQHQHRHGHRRCHHCWQHHHHRRWRLH